MALVPVAGPSSQAVPVKSGTNYTEGERIAILMFVERVRSNDPELPTEELTPKLLSLQTFFSSKVHGEAAGQEANCEGDQVDHFSLRGYFLSQKASDRWQEEESWTRGGCLHALEHKQLDQADRKFFAS